MKSNLLKGGAMSIIRKPNKAIDELMETLVQEYKSCKIEGNFWRRWSLTARRHDIFDRIVKLRASMNPQCDCKKIEQNESP
jgi:hypothetical protein